MNRHKIGRAGASLLCLIMMFALLATSAWAADDAAADNIIWRGAMNYNDANNQVTNAASMTGPADTELKWAYPLNTTVMEGGAYYAGTQVIVGDYLYATGGGKLHKINVKTGEGETVAAAGSMEVNETDYLCYGNGKIFVAIRENITAYDAVTFEQEWSVGDDNTDFGQYHTIKYLEHDGAGYIWCNGRVYNAENGAAVPVYQQDGETELNASLFNWSNGAVVGDYFYITDKYNVYAINMGTWKVADEWQYFDGDITKGAYNVSGQVTYDEESGRLFWGCKCAAKVDGVYKYKKLYSIKVGENGSFVADSERIVGVGDTGITSICAPVVHNGRVYLVGQGNPHIAVFDIDTVEDSITLAYTVGGSATIQSNAILSVAGEKPVLYYYTFGAYTFGAELFAMVDGEDSGAVTKLASTPNYTGVKFPNSYEQIAMDDNGNIYCYNESGWLFCYGTAACEVPAITADLSADQVKVDIDAAAEALTVAAGVSDGGALTYQWQSSEDGMAWGNIAGAEKASYTPGSAAADEGTTYYRCVITNNKDGKTASIHSSAAEILVKDLSTDTSLNVMVNEGNNAATGTNPAKASLGDDGIIVLTGHTAKVTNLWLGTVDEGSISGLELYHGIPADKTVSFTSKTSSNVYDETTYNGYYRYSAYEMPIVAKAEVTAEDGVTKQAHYIIIESVDEIGKYIVAVNGFTADNDYFSAENGIKFTEKDQTVTLTADVTTIGSGDLKTEPVWASSDESVATVEDGVVTCVGNYGTAEITYSSGRVAKTVVVRFVDPEHNTHTYVDGKCSVCGEAEPGALKVFFTLIDPQGELAVAKDGVTKLYKAELSVNDVDGDGDVTVKDAFIVLHTAYSTNGADDFVTEVSAFGPYIAKMWGVENGSVSYVVNNSSVLTLLEELKANDVINAYFYRDTTYWSDLYAYFEDDTIDMTVDKAGTFSVNGLASGVTVVAPKGAAVSVYDADGNALTEMATTVADDGSFKLSFAAAGTYTVEVGGTASYTGSAWDYETGSYVEKEFTDVPVVPAFCTVTVAGAQGGGSSGVVDEGISVKFSLVTHKTTWIAAHTIKLDAGATVADAFYKVLDNRTGFSYEADPNYVSSITYKGTTLAEFTEGPNSGWKYRINGVAPGVGMAEKTLEDGDELVWYYVVDYTEDTDRDEGDYSGSVTVTADDRAAAKDVKDLIAAIGTVDENSAEAIKAARAAYEELTDVQKDLVPNLDVLTAAEKAYAELTGEVIAPAATSFADVNGHWAADAITYVYEKGLMKGQSESSFAPDLATSRAMITTILYRLAGSPEVEGGAGFADVASGTWYADAIRWAEVNNVVSGYADGSFGTNDNVTREQLASILYRFAAYSGQNMSAAADLSSFADADSVSEWARTAMEWANAEGLITGKTGNVIDAKGKATRAEVATILMRYLAD